MAIYTGSMQRSICLKTFRICKIFAYLDRAGISGLGTHKTFSMQRKCMAFYSAVVL